MDIGTVTAIRLTEDHRRVIVKVQMACRRPRSSWSTTPPFWVGAAAHLGGQRDGAGHADIGGVYRAFEIGASRGAESATSWGWETAAGGNSAKCQAGCSC